MHTAGPVVSQLSASEVEMLLKNCQDINYQVLIKFLQNYFKQEVGQCTLKIYKSTNYIKNMEELPQH
jgi:ribosomal protein S24E